MRTAPPLGRLALRPFIAVTRAMDRIWIATMTELAANSAPCAGQGRGAQAPLFFVSAAPELVACGAAAVDQRPITVNVAGTLT